MIPPIQKEIKALTGIRGLAACLVMFKHFHVDRYLAAPFNNIINNGYLSVDLFFVLSGFVMALTYSSFFSEKFYFSTYRKFMLLRIARVYPLYFVAVGICSIACIVNPQFNDISLPVNFKNILINLLMIQAWGLSDSFLPPAWSISTEFFAYLIFPVLLCLVKTRNSLFLSTFFAFLMLVWLSVCQGSWIYPETNQYPMNLWKGMYFAPLLRCATEFFLGIIAFRFHQRHNLSIIEPHQKWIGVSVAVAVLAPLFFIGADLLTVLLLPFFVITLTFADNPIAKLLSTRPIYFLGLISYSLYLCHIMTNYVRASILEQIRSIPLTHEYHLVTILQIVLSIILATCLYYFVEKPSRNLFRRMISK